MNYDPEIHTTKEEANARMRNLADKKDKEIRKAKKDGVLYGASGILVIAICIIGTIILLI